MRKVPYYLQIRDHLASRIEEGELRARAKLPSERALSEAFSITRMTARQGIDQGGSVAPGDEFATVQWENNSRESLIVPDNCSGTIEDANRNIAFVNLPFDPQWLLILTRE